jgi:formylmethanofuran dehydrogenase subunit C
VLKLTLRAPGDQPLDLLGITPDRLAKLSAAEVPRLLIHHGNRQEELGQFFDVSGSPSDAEVVFYGTTNATQNLGAGMATGHLFVFDQAGYHAGAGMSGGRLTLDGGAAGWAGAEMKGGYLEIRGNAGNQVGAAYRGSRRGMTGGTIVARGAAGDEVGLLMRRGVIVVDGECGRFAGASMIAGSLFLLGEVDSGVGAGMKRGTIVTRQPPAELPPSFRYSCRYRPSFISLNTALFNRDAFPVNNQWGHADCYRGDLLCGGKGELLVLGKG